MSERVRFRARLLDLGTYEELTREMIRLEADRGGVALMAPKGIIRNILVEQVPTKAANIIKQELLVRGGDLVTPWAAADFAWDTVDVIVMGNLVTLRSTISKLYRQTVYHLPEFADALQDVLIKTTPGYLPVAREVRRQGVVVEETVDDLHGGRIPLGTAGRARGRPTLAPPYGRPDWAWAWGSRTYIMGILKISPPACPDARTAPPPADGPESRAAAVAEGRRLAAAGADLIEVAGDAAGADVVPVIRQLRQELPEVLVAITTWRAEVAAAALQAGAHLIRDTGAMRRDPEMRDVAAQYRAPIVVRHSQADATYRDLMSDIARFFWEVLDEGARAGVQAEQVLLDPGFGCGKKVRQDLELTRRLRELTSFGRPLLYAPSRQPSIGRVLGGEVTAAEQLFGTAAAIAAAIANGADIVRVHDVPEMKRCVQMADALVRGYTGAEE